MSLSSPSFRVDSVLDDIGSDALNTTHGASPTDIAKLLPADKKSDLVVTNPTLIGELIKQNQDLWQTFVKHQFATRLALLPDGSLNEKFFKKYLRQDYYYLLNSIRFRAARLAKFRTDADYHDLSTELGKITSAYEFAKSFRQVCLGFQAKYNIEGKVTGYEPEKLLENIAWKESELDDPNGPDVEVLGYNSFLQDRVSLDDWFTLYIANIPCLYGYALIASQAQETKEYKDKSANKIFSKHWIDANAGYASSNKLSAFLDANKKRFQSESTLKYWDNIFKSALKFEIALFESCTPK